MSGDAGTEVDFSEALRGGEEMPERVRLRVALDIVLGLDDAGLGARSDESRLRLKGVRVDKAAGARIEGAGDATGLPVLLWEILSGREAPSPPLPRLHHLVDEIHPDVDDFVESALAGRVGSIGDLLEELERAISDKAASREDAYKIVATWVGQASKPATPAAAITPVRAPPKASSTPMPAPAAKPAGAARTSIAPPSGVSFLSTVESVVAPPPPPPPRAPPTPSPATSAFSAPSSPVAPPIAARPIAAPPIPAIPEPVPAIAAPAPAAPVIAEPAPTPPIVEPAPAAPAPDVTPLQATPQTTPMTPPVAEAPRAAPEAAAKRAPAASFPELEDWVPPDSLPVTPTAPKVAPAKPVAKKPPVAPPVPAAKPSPSPTVTRATQPTVPDALPSPKAVSAKPPPRVSLVDASTLVVDRGWDADLGVVDEESSSDGTSTRPSQPNAKPARASRPEVVPPRAETTVGGKPPAVLLFVGKKNAPLIEALQEAGYSVLIGKSAEDLSGPVEGLRTVIIDIDEYPDAKTSLIARLRDGEHASVPALVLAPPTLMGKLMGKIAADAFLPKPFRPSDAVVQVGALVRMSRRLEHAPPPRKALAGDVAQVSAATVLTILGLERRTGVFELTTPERELTSIDLASGCTVSGKVRGEDRPVAEALRAMLGIRRGRFSFRASPEREVPPGAIPLRDMLLDVARTMDEATRDAKDGHGPGKPRRA